MMKANEKELLKIVNELEEIFKTITIKTLQYYKSETHDMKSIYEMENIITQSKEVTQGYIDMTLKDNQSFRNQVAQTEKTDKDLANSNK